MKIIRYNKMNESNKRLDNILDKVSKYGMKNLTDDEILFLKNEDTPNKQTKYNELIVRLLSDLKDGGVTDDIFKKFIDKYVSKDELSDFIIQLFNDNRLNHILIK